MGTQKNGEVAQDLLKMILLIRCEKSPIFDEQI